MIDNPYFYLAAVPAVILLGLAKGGFAGIGTLAVPLLALVVAPVQAAAITLPILMVQDVISVWAYWRKWDKRNLMILLPSATIGIVLGYLLAAKVSDGAFYLALGLISAVFGARNLFAKRHHAQKGRRSRRVFLGRGFGLHQHDRQCRRAAVSALRPAAAASAR